MSIFILILFCLIIHCFSQDNTLVSWDSTLNKCVPDVCRGSKITEIAGYNNQMTVSLVNSTTLYDTAKTRQCFKDKYIVILGDSSLIETTHDMILLLTKLGDNDNLLHKYLANCVGHGYKPRTEFKFNSDSVATVQLDKKTGHHNLTYILPDYNIRIRYRFTGGNALASNNDGIVGKFLLYIVLYVFSIIFVTISGFRLFK